MAAPELPAVPPHEQWSPSLKWWLLWQYASARFVSWKTAQVTWEELLRDSLNGVRSGVGPNRAGFSLSTPASVIYPRAIELAAEWKAAGASIDPPPNVSRKSK